MTLATVDKTIGILHPLATPEPQTASATVVLSVLCVHEEHAGHREDHEENRKHEHDT